MKNYKLSNRTAILKKGVAVVALCVALQSGPAFAQSTPEEGAEEDVIIVTGSRISRPELEVAAPITSISAEEIAKIGTTNITDFLTRNPALANSVDRAASTLNGQGAIGANFLNLRNLGTNRTLTLVNGRRHVSGIASSANVDTNSIPSGLIEKVDVLTGGTSAIYGADGVSGVVNFVLKRDFDGIKANGQVGISQLGDAGTRNFSIVVGKNFASGRGNVAIAYDYNQSDQLRPIGRDFVGDPLKTFSLLTDPVDFAAEAGGVTNNNRPDNIIYNNVRWSDSSPDGAIDLNLDGIPDFTGLGAIYDRGLILPASGGRTIGGSGTQTAGYFGDLLPKTTNNAINLLFNYDITSALRIFAEGKFFRAQARSEGQPSFDFFTTLASDNAFLAQRFGVGAAPDGAYISRDNIDLGFRGEKNRRQTLRGVAGLDGDISENAKFELSYVYGQTKVRSTETNNLIRDRFFAALDAVAGPNDTIVCRSTLDPTSPIDPLNFGKNATTFTPGASSPCRPLNLLGDGVFSQSARDFVIATTINRAKIKQQVASAAITGNFDSLFTLPGGSVKYAFGAEYRREASVFTPDQLIQNGELRDFSNVPITRGKFDVKEAFAEIDVPILSDRPFFNYLALGSAIRLSDYSTSGKTTTWNVQAIYAPVKDIRFRGTYAIAVRAPNIGELFAPLGGNFAFVADPCDRNNVNEGTSFRAANCATILGALGLSAAQIAAFSPSTDAQNATSRRGSSGGNPLLAPEEARTWTAGIIFRPSFIPRLTVTADWYNVRIRQAINTPSATEVAELCVDQPTTANAFCPNIFRATGTGFVLGDGNDPAQRIGFISGPQNVAAFRTSGLDLSINYRTGQNEKLGTFGFNLIGGYLDKISFVPSIGADANDDIRENGNPRFRGTVGLDWKKDKFTLNYVLQWSGKTRRYVTETLKGNPDISDPRYFFIKELWDHSVRASYEIKQGYSIYAGVNNLANQKPDTTQQSNPISAIGRAFYIGLDLKL